jgi:CHAT domain-containing protein
LRVRTGNLVPEPWERYRQFVWDEHIAHRAGFAQRAHDRPFDPGIREAAGVLAERFKALAPRIAAGRADEDLACQAEKLLRDLEELRDQRCPRGGSDWEDLQRRCADLMILLARMANGRGRPGQARDWFRRAAAAWRDLGETAWVQECLLDAESALLADGGDAEAVLETLDSWLGERLPPVRRAKLLARTARILVDAGDYAAARLRADEAAGMLDAAGFTDPVAAGSAEEAFAAWVATDYREPVPGLPWLQVQPLFGGVATIWEMLTELRLLLGTLPRPQVLHALDDVDALRRRLLQEASAVGRQIEFAIATLRSVQPGQTSPVDGDATADTPAGLYRQLGDRHRRLAALHDEAQHAVPGTAEVDLLVARMAGLEWEAVQAGDALTASLTAVEQASTLSAVDRFGEAAAVLDTARARLGNGDGLDTARRRALVVTILRRAATVAGMQKQFPRLSQLCGDAIAEFEQDRDQVSEPYRQDSYLRNRVTLYELGVFAAWKLGDHELALVRADLAKAHGALGWVVPGGTPPPSEIASPRAEWSRLAGGRDLARRSAVWGRLMAARARAWHAAPPRLELAALQAALAPDEAIIYHYFVARDTLLIYVITPTGVGAERRILHGVRSELDQFADDIEALRGEMDWLGQDIPRLSAHLLPQDTAHLLDGVRRLLICPHRILHHIPFHALDWEHAPLIERFAVSYVPNVTSLLLPRPSLPPPDVLSVGIESYAPLLPDLPGAEQEASDVAAIYQRTSGAATVLLGAGATRTRLEAGDLERFGVIHFVTHGRDLPADEPSAAALYLSDGPVDAMDISQWTLRADLVAMSACWSGRRPVHGRMLGLGAEREELFGDEIYGLQAAFFAAGARRVLGTLWPLDNGTAPEVMSAFHAGLAARHAPELALQAAINQQRLAGRSFYHWAPYKLVSLGRPAAGIKER